MLLVYTHKITPRLTYIFKHIFVRILHVPISFTTKVEEFVAHNGPKFTYTNTALGKEFFIRNHSLLYDQGINDFNIKISDWSGIPCFFPTSEQSSIPFDIFSASFYLMSRYEEYQPHVADKYGRFSAKQSIAFQGEFLEKPIIDIWAFMLLEKLKIKYPDYEFSKRKFRFISTINVNEAFAYRRKGIIRNIAGFFTDLFKFRFESIGRRFMVLLNINDDPFNTYEQIVEFGKNYKIKTLFFFLFSEYSTFDNNISYTNRKYKLLIKSIIDYVPFGQLFSFYTMKDLKKMNKEKNRFENVVNTPIIRSRQHYNHFEVPKTYQNLVDVGIVEDYSMGYYTHLGFRASTCTPFYFYDLDYEIQTPLLIYPFAVNDETLNKQQLTVKEAYLKIESLKHQVKQVNGTFITLFHNQSLSDMKSNRKWKTLYEKILNNN